MDPYAPCSCGSGKKFKFCCRDKVREQERAEKAEIEAAQRALELRPDVLARLDEEERRGQELLDEACYAEAAAHFEALIAAHPALPGPHVYLAEARLGEGRLAEVAPILELHLRLMDGDDPAAASLLARVELLAGRRAEALQVAERLWRSRAIDEEALWQKVFTSALFRREEELLRWVERWTYPDHPVAADLHYFAGVAAANLGRAEQALESFELAFSSRRYGDIAESYHHRLERGRGPGSCSGRWAYFEILDLVPEGLLDRWIAKREAPSAGLRDFVIECLDDASTTDAEGLALLGAIGDEVSVAALRAYARGQSGSFGFRLRAIGALHEAGALTLAEPCEVWTGASWCASPPLRLAVHAGDSAERVSELHMRIAKAPERLREFVEAELALHPEDWCIRVFAARYALLQQGPAAALSTLEARPLPSEATADLYLDYGVARVSIALELGELDEVAPWVLFCARVSPSWSHDDLLRSEVEALFDRETPFDRAAWERRQRSLEEQDLAPSFHQVLLRRTWTGIRDFANAQRILTPVDLGRTERIERIFSSLQERDFAPLLEDLPPHGRDALDTLHAWGGAIPLEVLEHECQHFFRDDGRDEIDALLDAMDLIDQLEERALVAIGPPAEGVEVPGYEGEPPVRGEPCVFLVREVGELLDAAALD